MFSEGFYAVLDFSFLRNSLVYRVAIDAISIAVLLLRNLKSVNLGFTRVLRCFTLLGNSQLDNYSWNLFAVNIHVIIFFQLANVALLRIEYRFNLQNTYVLLFTCFLLVLFVTKCLWGNNIRKNRPLRRSLQFTQSRNFP